MNIDTKVYRKHESPTFGNTLLGAVPLVSEVYLMDNIELMKHYPDKYFDLAIVDPPYEINANLKRGDTGKNKHIKQKDYHVGDWDKGIPPKEYFDEMFRISKNQIIFGGNYFIEYLKNTRCMITWYKREGLPDRTFADSELAWTSFDKNSQVYSIRHDGFIRDSKEPKEAHPTQKPLKLFQQILADYSKEGELILDCFSGSGTTAIACHNLNRNFICIEKDYDYWKASVERLENAQAQCKLF